MKIKVKLIVAVVLLLGAPAFGKTTKKYGSGVSKCSETYFEIRSNPFSSKSLDAGLTTGTILGYISGLNHMGASIELEGGSFIDTVQSLCELHPDLTLYEAVERSLRAEGEL